MCLIDSVMLVTVCYLLTAQIDAFAMTWVSVVKPSQSRLSCCPAVARGAPFPEIVASCHDRDVWLTDVGRHQVFKFSHDGQLLLTVGERRLPGWDATHFNEPTGVAVAADGSFFVSDGYQNARVAHFAPDGKFLKEGGAKGTAPGQFQIPHGVALDDRGRVYVADRQNSRLQTFATAGTFVREWWGAATLGRRRESVTLAEVGSMTNADDSPHINEDIPAATPRRCSLEGGLPCTR
jgi:DNA-binding beta-propeller fold protein YncE